MERIVLPWVIEHLVQAGLPDAADLLFAEHLRRVGTGDRVAAFYWDDIINTVAQRANVGWPHDLPNVMSAGELAAPLGKERFYSDVPAALGALQERGYNLAVLTNGHVRYQQVLIDQLGAQALFSAVLGPDILRITKPDPGVFDHPALTGGVITHVGDLMTQDVRVARRAGVKAVLIVRHADVDGLDESKHASAQERPLLLWQSGVLARLFAREHAYLHRPLPTQPLAPDSECFPDAIIFSFNELLDLL